MSLSSIALQVFKGLYENASNSAHVDAHLAILSAIRDVSKLVVKELTSWVCSCWLVHFFYDSYYIFCRFCSLMETSKVFIRFSNSVFPCNMLLLKCAHMFVKMSFFYLKINVNWNKQVKNVEKKFADWFWFSFPVSLLSLSFKHNSNIRFRDFLYNDPHRLFNG